MGAVNVPLRDGCGLPGWHGAVWCGEGVACLPACLRVLGEKAGGRRVCLACTPPTYVLTPHMLHACACPTCCMRAQDNKYVCCSKCQAEVVGMYWASTATPNYNLCFRCHQSETRGDATATTWVAWGALGARALGGGQEC